MRALLLVAALAVSSSAVASGRGRVSLELHKADVHTVLRLFADLGRLNLVADESVSGRVTVQLRDVTWEEAFAAVLASRGLGSERLGRIVRVAPLGQLAEEAKRRADIAEAERLSAPLKTTLVRVNYASAADMAAQVKPLLSPRGSVSVDARTNTVIIRDIDLP